MGLKKSWRLIAVVVAAAVLLTFAVFTRPKRVFEGSNEIIIQSIFHIDSDTREESDVTAFCDTDVLKECLSLMEISRFPDLKSEPVSNAMEYEINVSYLKPSLLGEKWHIAHICVDADGESYLYESAGQGYYRLVGSNSWCALLAYLTT